MAIADYLRKLVEMKNQLVANLNSMGVAADESEKLNTLVPKVLECENGGATFDSDGLMYLSIKDGVTEIPNYAFSGLKYLQSVEIPHSVTTIGTSAFSCSPLPTICIPSTVSRDFFPWGLSLSKMHNYDENGVCSVCGHQASIIFNNDETWTNENSFESKTSYMYRYYRSTNYKKGTFTDTFSFKVYKAVPFYMHLWASASNYSDILFTLSALVQKVNNETYEDILTVSCNNTYRSPSTSPTVNLAPGTYKVTISAVSNSSTVGAGFYYYVDKYLQLL